MSPMILLSPLKKKRSYGQFGNGSFVFAFCVPSIISLSSLLLSSYCHPPIHQIICTLIKWHSLFCMTMTHWVNFHTKSPHSSNQLSIYLLFAIVVSWLSQMLAKSPKYWSFLSLQYFSMLPAPSLCLMLLHHTLLGSDTGGCISMRRIQIAWCHQWAKPGRVSITFELEVTLDLN